jgi:hypothetical protein
VAIKLPKIAALLIKVTDVRHAIRKYDQQVTPAK